MYSSLQHGGGGAWLAGTENDTSTALCFVCVSTMGNGSEDWAVLGATSPLIVCCYHVCLCVWLSLAELMCVYYIYIYALLYIRLRMYCK